MHRLRNSRAGGAGSLPAVGTLINQAVYAALIADFGRARVVAALREQVEQERGGTPASDSERVRRVEDSLRRMVAPTLLRVVNASGVILHTNLGRAPLSRAAVESVATAAAGYTNTARYVTRPIAPLIAGATLRGALGAPFFIAGALKSVYDLGLYVLFRNVRVEGEGPPEAATTGY